MKLIKNIFLAVLSIFLLIIVLAVALIREAFVLFTKRKNDFKNFFKGFYFGLSYAFYSIALIIDKASAQMFPSLWNLLFIKNIQLYENVCFGSKEAIALLQISQKLENQLQQLLKPKENDKN